MHLAGCVIWLYAAPLTGLSKLRRSGTMLSLEICLTENDQSITTRTWDLRLIIIDYLVTSNICEVAVADIDILGFPEHRHLAIAMR